MKPILLTAAGNRENQDRGLVLEDINRIVLCVADGAGGLSGGTEAATIAVEAVRENASLMNDSEICVQILRQLDTAINKHPIAGETTCALAVVKSGEIFGASVGDSGVWFVEESGSHSDLTQAQQRKPLIGSATAWPVPFRRPKQAGYLLLATDGLLKYTSPQRIIETCRQQPIELGAQKLIDLVRYASGALPDDVTIILTKV